MIPQTFIDDLSESVDLVGYISRHIELKKSGHDYQACCPFHSEDSPSFTVSPQKGFYHCFGCQAHGGAIKFAMEHLGLKFVEAVQDVAAYAGMEVPKPERPEKTAEEKQGAIRYMKALDALNTANACFSARLPECEEARAYLEKRGVSAESIEKFSIGYAPNAWDTISGKRQYTREVLLDAGLVTKRDGKESIYDRFRDRIMFPIYGKKDAIVGFGGRAISGQDPKYLNSPESIVFDKGSNLYGLKQADAAIRSEKRVFVVEGYMDVVMTSQFGVENVVASLGTSITEGQMRKLFRLSEHVTFCMDGDAPGQKAAWRAAENILPLLDDSHRVDFMFIPDGMDPDEYMRAHGRGAFMELAEQALTLTDYVLDELVNRTDMQNGESLARYLSDANGMAEKLKSPVVKLSFQKRVAELAGISLDTMLAMLKEQKQNTERAGDVSVTAPSVEAKAAESSPSVNVAERPSISVVPIAPAHAAPEVSVAAKMLGITAVHDRDIAEKLNPDFIGRFLGSADKEMLFPLLAYLKANPGATEDAIIASLSFNPHAALISMLVNSAAMLGADFDAKAEARATLERFKAMENVWGVVRNAQKMAAA